MFVHVPRLRPFAPGGIGLTRFRRQTRYILSLMRDIQPLRLGA